MYSLRIISRQALAKIVVSGAVSVDEMAGLGRDLERILLDPTRTIRRVLADLRPADPPTAEVSALLRSIEDWSLQHARFAEVVLNEIVAHQLNQMSRAANHQQSVRYFWDLESAWAWLQEPSTGP